MYKYIAIGLGIVGVVFGIFIGIEVGVAQGIIAGSFCIAFSALLLFFFYKNKQRKLKAKNRCYATPETDDLKYDTNADVFDEHMLHIKRKRSLAGALCRVYLFVDRDIMSAMLVNSKGLILKCKSKKCLLSLAWTTAENNEWHYSDEYVITGNQNAQLVIKNHDDGFGVFISNKAGLGDVALIVRPHPAKWYKIWENLISGKLSDRIKELLIFKIHMESGGYLVHFLYKKHTLAISIERSIEEMIKILPDDLSASYSDAYKRFIENESFIMEYFKNKSDKAEESVEKMLFSIFEEQNEAFILHKGAIDEILVAYANMI